MKKDKELVSHLFNNIAPVYDFLNRFLSMGIDQYWRKTLAKHVVKTADSMILLDIATGTGDQIISLCQKFSFIKKAIGIDIAKNMLLIGKKKVLKKRLEKIIILEDGDAANIKYKDNYFDMVSCSFGIRNVEKPEVALAEIYRVIKPGGQLLILEFSLPQNRLSRNFYLFYFRRILPVIGNFFAKHSNAYSYLNKSVEYFHYGVAFVKMLQHTGFIKVKNYALTFGIATLYTARKKDN